MFAKKGWKKTGIILIVVLLALLTVCLCRGLDRAYMKAVDLACSGQYEAAATVLQRGLMGNYRDAPALLVLCEAMMLNANGDYSIAYYTVRNIRGFALPDEYAVPLLAMRKKIEADYEASVERRRAWEKERYLQQVRTGEPFVGMAEADIANTILGSPSPNVDHNRESINGKQYVANIYRFYEDGKLIFTARCVLGEVTEVWNERGRTYSVPGSKRKTEPQDDPYGAADYTNEEDFYDDHYDDFFSYEDAEEYWREHQ